FATRVGGNSTLRLDRQLAEEEAADPGAGVHVAVRNSSRRKVDAIAAQDPARGALELDLRHELRAVALTSDSPLERRTGNAHGPRVRLVSLEVVDDPVSGRSLQPIGMLVEREDQWKYWPPSMTMVWPVMKSAPGVQRKTTAPTTSSGTWSRWIVRAATETSRSF